MSEVQIIRKGSFDKILSAIDQMVDLIKPTFGPASNKVIISKPTHGWVVDDGVQIARDLELSDPVEHAIMKVARETAIKTNDRVGDGTTGSLILLQAILREVAKRPNFDGRQVEKELKTALEDLKVQLTSMARPVKSKAELRKVARVSFDNEEIANMIADACFELGEDGVLTVDRSGTMETFVELTDGIKIDKGYISPYMITNPARMEGVIEKPYILITDYRLTEANDVIGIMGKLLKKGINSLVIVCENMEQNALATAVINKAEGKFNVIAINSPSYHRETFLEDLAIMTGGRFFSEKKGDKLETAEITDLGRANKFIARRKESVIVGPKGDKKEQQEAVKDLTIALALETKETLRDDIKKRIAMFSNKVGVIKVGAPTQQEMDAQRYKVEDAVNSTQAAFKSGVVAGGGIALKNLKTDSEILSEALQVPFRQLKINVGMTSHRPLKAGEAINVVSGDIGQWMEVGVMDPVEVILAQLDGAISIASLLVTTSGMIVEPPKPFKQE